MKPENNTAFRRQTGLTMVSWLVIITIAMFFFLIGVKMVPTYLEHYSIKQVLHGLEDDRTLRKVSRAELKRIVLKRFKINSVYNFNPKDLVIAKSKKGLNLTVTYEVRKPVIGNVAVVMAFSDQVEIRQ